LGYIRARVSEKEMVAEQCRGNSCRH